RVRDAEAGHEVLLVEWRGKPSVAGSAWAASRKDHRASTTPACGVGRVQVYSGKVVAPIVEGRVKRPPQSGIDRELWRNFDGVLHEQTLSPINSIGVDVLNVPRTTINVTQQEAGKGVTAQRDPRLAGFQSG